jgi:hypothetical protein
MDGLGAGSGYTVPLNKWVSLAFVHDGFNTMELYGDGKLLARRTDLLAGVPGVAAGGISIGNAVIPSSQRVLDGEIDEVKVWRTDPLAMWHDFIQRPINPQQAACWAQFTAALADARATDPDCAREVMLGLSAWLDRIIRAIIAKGPKERERLEKLHREYLALWRGGNIHGRAMRKLIAECIAWLHGLGIFPDKDADLLALIQSPCFASMVNACEEICDQDFAALIALVARELGHEKTGKAS